MSGLLRDVREKLDKYEWIKRNAQAQPIPPSRPDDPDADIHAILRDLRA
ncbi:hypothetical protein [Bosea sp. 685]|nr:hypothetical protein [Bosea sp. 685]WNJ89581.1 hypothetical protein RMR04_24735 [Bosea sp. 685]